MENIWFTSDTHFYHNRIQEFCPTTRPGKDVGEMTEMIVHAWNSRVKPSDRIYHLGDFSFGSVKQTDELIRRLNGRKHIIRGNHDGVLDSFKSHFESYRDYGNIKLADKKFVLMHYPIESWDGMHRGAIHLHGHLHGDNHRGSRLLKNRMDVGVDTRAEKDMAPYHLDEVLARLEIHNGAIDLLRGTSEENIG